MSHHKQLISELAVFLSTFISFIGFILWAWIGRGVSRYTESLQAGEKFSLVILLAELPVAIGMGVMLGGFVEFGIMQEWFPVDHLIAPALVSAGAYLGPRMFREIWDKYIARNQNNVNVYVDHEHYDSSKYHETEQQHKEEKYDDKS